MAYDTKLPQLLACFAFLLVISYASAQSCAPHHVAVCAGIIPDGTPVYVPPFLSIDILEIYATGIVSLLNYAGVVEPCHSYALQLTCGSWLRPCLVVGNETLPIPHEPCLDMCWTYYNACANVYPYNSGDPTLPIGVGLYFPTGSAPLDCTKPIYDIWAGNITYYQPGDYVVTDPQTNQNLSVTCSMSTPIAVPAPTYCEEPLELTSYPSTGAPSCAFSCPVPSLSDSEYDNVKIMQGLVGWLSWSLSAMLILMLLFNPKTRDFPRNLVIMVACAANIAAGAIVLPTYAGYDNIWCGGSDVYLIPNGDVVGNDQYGLPIVDWNTDETFLSVESSACTFQGAMLQFGFLAAVFWWVLIAFNMTLELYVGRYLPLQAIAWKWSRFGVYLFIGWGLPFILMVIPAAAGRIKFPPAGSYCFVTNEDNYAWSLTFWFIPVGLSLLFGVILFIAALIRVAFLLVNLKKVMKLVVLYLRLLLFIFLYLMQFVFLFAYQIQVAKDKNDIDQGYSDYYNCLILATDGCSLSESVSNYNLVMLKAWAISSLGTLLFLVFISWDVLKFWYNVFRTLGMVFVKRDAQAIFSVINLFTYQSSHTTLVSGNSNSLTVTGVEDDEEEMRSVEDRSKHNKTTEEEEEEDNDSSSTESSD